MKPHASGRVAITLTLVRLEGDVARARTHPVDTPAPASFSGRCCPLNASKSQKPPKASLTREQPRLKVDESVPCPQAPMKSMSTPDPKLVKLGEDLPWDVDGARGDLTVNEDNMRNVAFASGKSTRRSIIGPEVQRSRGPEVQRSRGPEVQRPRGPEAQRSSTPGVVCHEGRPTGSWRTSSGPHIFNRLPVQG